jgi:hypothetical protein
LPVPAARQYVGVTVLKPCGNVLRQRVQRLLSGYQFRYAEVCIGPIPSLRSSIFELERPLPLINLTVTRKRPEPSAKPL